jgi:hypothetical protein
MEMPPILSHLAASPNWTTGSRDRCAGNGLARGTFTRERGCCGRRGGRLLSGEFVLCGRSLQFFELQLHLVDDARSALRAGTVD